jgi:hypothetical protein
MGLGEIYEEKELLADEKLDPREATAQWDRYIGIGSTVAVSLTPAARRAQ